MFPSMFFSRSSRPARRASGGRGSSVRGWNSQGVESDDLGGHRVWILGLNRKSGRLIQLSIGCAVEWSGGRWVRSVKLRVGGRSWRHHIEVLADDNMEGRGTGTPGLQRAEAYVVDRLQKADLIPAGVDGYYQPVSFESREIVEEDCDAVLVRAGTPERLVLGRDAHFSGLHVSLPVSTHNWCSSDMV